MNIRNRNKIHNRNYAGKIRGMINGQATGVIPELRYGLFSMSYNGCEVIAVYNALAYMNKNTSLDEVAYIMEKHRILLGIFGCSPYCFDKLGNLIRAERIRSIDGIRMFIISFWNDVPFLSGIHTVFCTSGKNGIIVYNRYNQDTNKRMYPDFESFKNGRKIISAYAVKN